MKCRTSFVSNSSSSSFIITNKEYFDKVKKILKNCMGDYYEYNDILYTSPVHDGYTEYNTLYELSNDAFEYNEYGYSEIEGERGVNTVYVPHEAIQNTNTVYGVVKSFFDQNSVIDLCCTSGDKKLYDFFNELYKVIYNTNEDME